MPVHQDLHLRIVRLLMLALGIWPIHTKYGLLKKLYNVYFIVGFSYLTFFEIIQLTRVIILITQRSWEESFVNLGVALTYTISLFKVYFLRAPQIQTLIKAIQEREGDIVDGTDEEVKKIYMRHVDQAQSSGAIYVGVGTGCIMMYFTNPLLYNFVFEQPDYDNVTAPPPKMLIFSAYLPFDTDQHYAPAYFIHLFGGLCGYSYTVYSDAIFFTIFIYCTGQIRILQHFMTNLYEYSVKYKKDSEQEITKNEAEFAFTVKCIFYHREIIEFVDRIDRTLSTFMLFEFLLASLKISMLILQILKNPNLEFGTLTVASYVLIMVMELFYFYWNANEIIYESSEGFVEAVFYGNWYELGPEIQKKLVFMILRAKTPCKISIGPFYVMCINAALSILKACYYYVCLIQQTTDADTDKKEH